MSVYVGIDVHRKRRTASRRRPVPVSTAHQTPAAGPAKPAKRSSSPTESTHARRISAVRLVYIGSRQPNAGGTAKEERR
jgi:hypothetical protein